MGFLVSIFTIGINSKSFPQPVHSVQETFQSILRRLTRVDNRKDTTDIIDIAHINVILSIINSLSLNYPVFSRSRTLLLVLSLKHVSTVLYHSHPTLSTLAQNH